MRHLPELSELVIGMVKKLMPFGAVISMTEFGDAEAFLHISEVSSGWIRNIREHLKEGQLVVVKVVLIESAKNQVDVSLKRVSEVERKRKLEYYQSQKRAVKLLERVSKKLAKPLTAIEKEVVPLVEEFGDLYTVFEALSHDFEPKAKVSKQLLVVLKEIAKQEIKIKIIELKGVVTAVSYSPDGLKELLAFLSKLPSPHYLGAGKYLVSVSSPEVKQAEKQLHAVEAVVEKAASPSFECSFERMK